MQKGIFSSKIIDWYQVHFRRLPWRETSDPYKIWLSEVILQQTRVAQGLPYYEQFLKSFPTIFDLAGASEQNVLRLWQGLGYYSRARNLHRCAKMIVEKFDGKFPSSLKKLVELPGVGDYTGAAIASIAFREPVAVVDGNVFRVLARIFGVEKDTASTSGKKYFFSLANQLIDHNRPDLFNQAMMEFGALHCVPKQPKCSDCPFSRSCEANQRNLQSVLPVKSKKIKARIRHFYYFVIRDKNRILMRQRIGNDIWRGLHDFYLTETSGAKKPGIFMKTDKLLANAVVVEESKLYKHTLTHQKLRVRFITTHLPPSKKTEAVIHEMGLRWVSKARVEKIPKPVLIDRFLKEKIHDGDFW